MRATSKLLITVDQENGKGPVTRTSLILDWNPMIAEEIERNGSFNNSMEIADFIENGFLNLIGVDVEET